MFITSNDLKGLIIDLDSFALDLDNDWHQLDESLKLLFFSSNKNRIESFLQKNTGFLVFEGSPVNLLGVENDIMVDILKLLELESYEVAIFSSSHSMLKKIRSIPISTIRFFSDEVISYDEVGELSDFIVSSFEEVNEIYNQENKGYFSEVAAIRYNWNDRIHFETASVIITEQNLQDLKVSIIGGGRYFNKSDWKHDNHQFSRRIIRNKNGDSEHNIFYELYSRLIMFINDTIEHVDSITRVPPRPSTNDRFKDIVERLCQENTNIQNDLENLVCIKDYPTQKGLNEEARKTNISGVFQTQKRFDNKHIVLLDDIISTGATTFEATKELYSAGARKVTILVLAINQFPQHMQGHFNGTFKCKLCGADMKLRFNTQTNSAFFGCSNYNIGTCKNIVQYTEGLRVINQNNRVQATVDNEQDDEFEFIF